MVKPYYRRKPASIEEVVLIGTFWYTIRGSNYFAILQTIENRRFEASPSSGVLKSVLKLWSLSYAFGMFVIALIALIVEIKR
ncbi:MAG: putative holin-like toxin [Ruminococcus sp.]